MGSTAKQDNYLTKRRLKSATAKAIKKASSEAYEVTDSVVTMKNGWVVRQYKNGKTTRIKKIPQVTAADVVLD